MEPGVAFFTAASAVCVTGLTVVDTPGTFSPLGQGLILLLVQAGGLGYMTASTLMAALLRRQPGLQDRLLLRDALGEVTLADTVRLFQAAVRFTLAMEAAGALLLALRFAGDPGRSPGEALWLGLANSVSAFCNADFVWLGTAGSPGSLGPYVADPLVNLTLASLIVTGGLGFVVCHELAGLRSGRRLSLQAKVVLGMSAALILGGTLLVAAFEWSNPGTLGRLSPPHRVLAASFEAIAVRTAGFTTLDFSQLHVATLTTLTLLMFVGASQGGTGGGVKTTTLAVCLAAGAASLRRRPDVELLSRRVPAEVATRALVLVGASALAVEAASLGLLCTDGARLAALGVTDAFVRLRFEAVSAFATAGVSTGITPMLSDGGRLILMSLMFAGRLGLVTLASAALIGDTLVQRRWPEERIPLG